MDKKRTRYFLRTLKLWCFSFFMVKPQYMNPRSPFFFFFFLFVKLRLRSDCSVSCRRRRRRGVRINWGEGCRPSEEARILSANKTTTNKQANKSYCPTKHLTLLQLHDSSIDISELHQIQRSTDFETLELWNVRSCNAWMPFPCFLSNVNRSATQIQLSRGLERLTNLNWIKIFLLRSIFVNLLLLFHLDCLPWYWAASMGPIST